MQKYILADSVRLWRTNVGVSKVPLPHSTHSIASKLCPRRIVDWRLQNDKGQVLQPSEVLQRLLNDFKHLQGFTVADFSSLNLFCASKIRSNGIYPSSLRRPGHARRRSNTIITSTNYSASTKRRLPGTTGRLQARLVRALTVSSPFIVNLTPSQHLHHPISHLRPPLTGRSSNILLRLRRWDQSSSRHVHEWCDHQYRLCL